MQGVTQRLKAGGWACDASRFYTWMCWCYQDKTLLNCVMAGNCCPVQTKSMYAACISMHACTPHSTALQALSSTHRLLPTRSLASNIRTCHHHLCRMSSPGGGITCGRRWCWRMGQGCHRCAHAGPWETLWFQGGCVLAAQCSGLLVAVALFCAMPLCGLLCCAVSWPAVLF